MFFKQLRIGNFLYTLVYDTKMEFANLANLGPRKTNFQYVNKVT